MSVAVYETCNDGHNQNLLETGAANYVHSTKCTYNLLTPDDSQNQMPKAEGIADIPDLLRWSKVEGVALKVRQRRGREH